MILVLIIFFSFLETDCSFSQPTHKYIHYNVNDGLPSNSVYTVIQDNQGFIWFSTVNGITSFDGYDFLKYAPDTSLAGMEVLKIVIQDSSRMWLLPYGNGAFYIENDSVNRLQNAALKKLFVSSMAFSGDTIWFGSFNGGVAGINLKHNHEIVIDEKQLGSKPAWVTTDSFGTLYIGASNKFCALRNAKLECIRINDMFFPKGGDLAVMFFKYSGLTAFTRTHVLAITKDTIMTLFNSEDIDIRLYINSVNEDASGNLLIATNKGGVRLGKKASGYRVERYLTDEHVKMFYEDAEGNYWFTTEYHGIYFLSKSSRNILCFFNSGDTPLGNIQFVKTLEKFPDKIFAGNSEGFLFTLEKDSVFSIDLRTPSHPPIISDVATVGDKAFSVATSFGLFMSTVQDFVLGNRNLKFSPVAPHSSYIGDSVRTYSLSKEYNFIKWTVPRTLETDTANGLWFGSNTGITRLTYDANNYSITRFNRERILRIKFDSLGNLYVLTLNGLGILNKDGSIFYPSEISDTVTAKISYFDIDSYNNLWVGTNGQGLFAFTSDTIYHYSQQNLLQSDRINHFQISNGHLYVAYANSVDRFQLGSTHINADSRRRFHLSSVLWSDEINRVHHQDSTIYLATNTGITFYNEHNYAEVENLPILNLKRIEIGGKSFKRPEHFEVPYNKAKFRVEYTGISFSSFKNILFRYKLEGIDDAWTETRERIAEFPKLPAGRYAFVLSAKTSNSEWVNPIRIELNVLPPFWQKSWFIILSLALFVFTTAAVASWRVSTVRKKARERIELNKRISEYKLKALQAQMNPHFISNALASIQRYVTANEGEKASGYLAKFSKLMRHVLESSIEENIALEDEISLLSLYLELESLRFAGKMKYNIHCAPEIDPAEIELPSMLIQPFVENAIVHGIGPKGSGTVKVGFSKEDNNLICVIEDDGIGMSERKETEVMKKFPSRSMELITQRLETINRTENKNIQIYITNLPEGNGVRIEIIVPIE